MSQNKGEDEWIERAAALMGAPLTLFWNTQGNWTMQEMLRVLQEITRIRAPRMKIPRWVAMAAAYVSEAMAGVTGKPPKAPLAGVRMAKYKMWFDSSKAVTQLGMPQTPPKQALADAVDWFKANGYVGK